MISNLKRFKTFISEAVPVKSTKLNYHQELNPKLWKGMKLIPKVQSRLIQIADLFIETLKLDKSKISDTIFAGSNCNFNWTELSDIDIHISVDFKKLKSDIPVDEYFQAKKSVWNLTHEIQIYGYDVEVYVNDVGEDLVGSASAYSLKNKKWIVEPKLETPDYTAKMIKVKANHFGYEIERALKKHTNDTEYLKKLNDKIGKYRRAGLAKHGEFSLENLTFKALRNNRWIEKLRKQINKSEDKKLNLEGLYIKGE